MTSGFVCPECNKIEFGEEWWKIKGKRVFTNFNIDVDSQDIYYAVARHNYDKHGIKGGTPDKEGEEFMKIALSDKYKNTDLGNIID